MFPYLKVLLNQTRWKQNIKHNREYDLNLSAMKHSVEKQSCAALSLSLTVHALTVLWQAATENNSNSGNDSETARWETVVYSGCLNKIK